MSICAEFGVFDISYALTLSALKINAEDRRVSVRNRLCALKSHLLRVFIIVLLFNNISAVVLTYCRQSCKGDYTDKFTILSTGFYKIIIIILIILIILSTDSKIYGSHTGIIRMRAIYLFIFIGVNKKKT